MQTGSLHSACFGASKGGLSETILEIADSRFDGFWGSILFFARGLPAPGCGLLLRGRQGGRQVAIWQLDRVKRVRARLRYIIGKT